MIAPALPTEVWKIGRDAFQARMGVHRPWIAEISPAQYAGMSKRAKAAYDTKREREWEASANCAQAYEQLCFAAFEADNGILTHADLHPDAKRAIMTEINRRTKEDAQARFRRAQVWNTLEVINQVKPGDRIYTLLYGRYVTVVKTFKASVRVRDDVGDEFTVHIGACQRYHYNELKALFDKGEVP